MTDFRRPLDRAFGHFVANCRDIVAPFADLTDAELAARTDLDPPVVRLVLNMRLSLRVYDEAEARNLQ